MHPAQSADDVRGCEFRAGDFWCDLPTSRPSETYDGGQVWLCSRHRSWLPALGRAPELNDGQEGT